MQPQWRRLGWQLLPAMKSAGQIGPSGTCCSITKFLLSRPAWVYLSKNSQHLLASYCLLWASHTHPKSLLCDLCKSDLWICQASQGNMVLFSAPRTETCLCLSSLHSQQLMLQVWAAGQVCSTKSTSPHSLLIQVLGGEKSVQWKYPAMKEAVTRRSIYTVIFNSL